MLSFNFDDTVYVIEQATPIKQKPGRPKNKMAKYSLLVRRAYGKKLYASFLYHDGTFCKPF